MNHAHLPRSIVILLSVLLAVTFLIGILSRFGLVHASTILNDLAPASTSTTYLPISRATPTSVPTLTPTASPTPETIYADTTGVIALGILMVVVVLIGIILGERKLLKKKGPEK